MSERPGVVAVVGSTATGKSALVHRLARERGRVEIVCVDSMTVYRGMDIGTAKPTRVDRAEVPYHLLDLVEPSETFTVRQFQHAARTVLREIAARGNVAVLVGGTGLYGRAVIDDFDIPGDFPEIRSTLEREAETDLPGLYQRLTTLDPLAATRMEPTNQRRIIRALEVTLGEGRPFSSFGPGLATYPDEDMPMIGLQPELADVDDAIAARFHSWLEAGFVDEVRWWASVAPQLSRTAAQAVGYKELRPYVDGVEDLDSCVSAALLATRQLVRRQRAWFRRDPRISWFAHVGDAEPVLRAALLRAAQFMGT